MTKQFILEQLGEIAGGPNEVRKLGNFGKTISVWVWDIKSPYMSNTRRTRQSLLVLSDKAQDLGLEFFRMRKVGNHKFEVTDKNELVYRVAIWYKEEN